MRVCPPPPSPSRARSGTATDSSACGVEIASGRASAGMDRIGVPAAKSRTVWRAARRTTGLSRRRVRLRHRQARQRMLARGSHEAAAKKPQRCAIYTRVSTENGLEQEFNSLHAQREAAQAYIKSQAHEGWKLIRDHYDDGGFSGGSLDRPGLQKLLADIRERRIDIVVVYKVDRLTRSLTDFAKLVELFDGHGVAFVSVTQSFNTTTSMGTADPQRAACPSPSSSERSPASASATRSRPPRRRGFGSAAWFPSATRSRTAN